MWNGGHPNDDPSQRGGGGPDDSHSRLTASALVAYAASGAAAAAAAAGFPNPMVPPYPPPPPPVHHASAAAYHLDAAAAAQLRAQQQHQEQMRQQALLAQLQHHPGVYHPHHAAAMDEMEYARQLAAARQHQHAAEEIAMQRMWEEERRRSFSAGSELPREITSSGPPLQPHQPISAELAAASEDMIRSTASDHDISAQVVALPPTTISSSDEVAPYMAVAPAPRGKPEAMAKALAAARVLEKIEELQAENDIDAVAEPVEEEEEDDEDDEMVDVKVEEDTAPAATVLSDETPKSKTKKPRKKPVMPMKKPKTEGIAPTLDDPAPEISDAEYECLEALMVQFCRVPLLAEFSRPVAILHPELMQIYSKIVRHPIDLGTVCRAIRRREYKNTRSFRLDMWRIFANCVKYHSHSSNKEAVPSFVSIALHLREYFNALWQEYMMPSDPPHFSPSGGKQHSRNAVTDAYLREAFEKRDEDRLKRLSVTGVTGMTAKCLERTVAALHTFIEQDGCVDRLDVDPVFGDDGLDDDDGDVRVVVDSLRKLQQRLAGGKADDESYGLEELSNDLKNCYSVDVLENKPSHRVRIGNRLNRFLGKIIVPIHEASCRGVGQSSIWGCMAAAVWARENGKKPFWPALVLGILAPEDQKEEWHAALTARNELRLPEKLRMELNNGKRKAEQAIRRQSLGQADPQSYFLVEFLGTHEFIWVKEADLIENFDPEDDPNQAMAAGNVTKKKRSSRSNPASVSGSKVFATAVEEGKWALEEFEMLLQDSGGDPVEEEEESGEMNYSYAVLSQSDDEADDEDAARNKDSKSMTMSDVEEANELLATDGLLDYSVTGRKNAKKRAAAMKKLKADLEKKERADNAKKSKEASGKKKKEAKSPEISTAKSEKVEKRETEKKGKKRGREREKVVKEPKRPIKQRRTMSPESQEVARSRSVSVRRNVINDKRGRATAIVRGYLARLARIESVKNVIGAVTIPASVVDSSNLLGMALAFRAAAGDLAMTDSGENPKPWEAIDVDGPKTAVERVKNLEQQMSLLEKEVSQVKQSIAQREKLTRQSVERFNVLEKEIYANDAAARKSHLLMKKKSQKTEKSPAVAKGKREEPDEDIRGESEAEEDEDEGPDNWATPPPVQVHEGDSD